MDKDYDDSKVALEEQFILRLPLEEARTLREIMHYKPEKLKKLLKLNLDIDASKITVSICKSKLTGVLNKLPTIIESYKTNIYNNKSTLFKTADICYIAECSYEGELRKTRETNHGICPPLKNVKTKRFRKTMYNVDFAVEAESVSKELYYLLSTDLEAVSSKFEIIYEGSHPKTIKDFENSLFGQLSSDSEVNIRLKNQTLSHLWLSDTSN